MINYNEHKIEYYSNSEIKYKEYYLLDGILHRIDGVAVTNYYYDGNVQSETYCINGKLHREDGPADIHYFSNGELSGEFYYLNNKLHRVDGPAYVMYYNDCSRDCVKYYLLLGKTVFAKEYYTPGFIDAFILENS